MSQKIMFVDDEELILDLAMIAARSIGIKNITVYNNANKAFSAYQDAKSTSSFDLIISDWQMPEMSGLEFLKKVREIDNEIPFVMLTASHDKKHIVDAIEAKVTDYVSKPFQIEKLIEIIRKHLK